MFKHMRVSLQNVWSDFVRNTEGSVVSTFALALVPLVGLTGAAIDYSAATKARTSLQAKLDAAVLAGARDGSTNWKTTALNVFNGSMTANFATNITPVFELTSTRAYTGSVTATVPASFLGVLGVSSIDIRVSATTTVPPSTGGYYCVMALNANARGALQLTGNASIRITAPKCVIQVNSTDTQAVQMNGNTWINSVENCFVGGTSTVGNSSIAPAPDATCKPIPDPFSAYPRPAVGGCDYTNYQLSGNKTVTLQPGVYCGGMNFSGPVNVTFSPGLYVIKDGIISESGGTFAGNGVTFFLTGLGASIQLSGQADWHIVASTGGPLPGFAIFLEPSGPTGLASTTSSLSGQAELYFEGIVYLPKQEVTVNGNASVVAPSPYTSYIGDTLRFVGNGDLVINNDTSLTSLPLPKAVMVQTNGRPILTQ